MTTGLATTGTGSQSLRVRELLAWERSAGICDMRVDGIPIWRLVRSAEISAYLSRVEGRGSDNYNRPTVPRLLRFVAGVCRSLVHLLRLRPHRYLVVGFARRRLEAGVWVDRFFDPLIDLIGPGDTLSIERPFVGRHLRPARTRNLAYYDAIKVIVLFGGAVSRKAIARRHGLELDRLATIVAPRLGVPVRRLNRSLARAYAEFRFERRCARYLIGRIRPSTLLLVNRDINYALIAACRERGVRVLELQHGVMHVEGYKQGTQYDERIDPEAFLTFGDAWTRFDWGMPPEAVCVVGNLHIWQQRELQRASGRPRGRAVMLVSEPGIWRKLQAPFAAIVAGNPGIPFILKLHPQDVDGWATRYPVGRERNVTVIEDPSADLYELFGHCQAAVGYGSTVLYEASFFGLKVCLLNGERDNPSEAIGFAGRYNFYEYSEPADFDRMLSSADNDESMTDNPFFAEFDAEVFMGLLA